MGGSVPLSIHVNDIDPTHAPRLSPYMPTCPLPPPPPPPKKKKKKTFRPIDPRAYGEIKNRTTEVRSGGAPCERVCDGPGNARSTWQAWCVRWPEVPLLLLHPTHTACVSPTPHPVSLCVCVRVSIPLSVSGSLCSLRVSLSLSLFGYLSVSLPHGRNPTAFERSERNSVCPPCSCDTIWIPDFNMDNVEELPEGRIAREE